MTPKAPSLDRILLIGMMGAGKSTVGRALGHLLGWPYWDNDDLLFRACGRTTRDVQENDGELALRRAESRSLDVALTEGGPLIAGIAGGVVTDPLDCERLRTGGYVVWLRASLGLLARRVAGTNRPWLGDSPLIALEQLYVGREHLYASVATQIVDVDHRDVAGIARLILAGLTHAEAAAAAASAR